jgi:hypothetical protein
VVHRTIDKPGIRFRITSGTPGYALGSDFPLMTGDRMLMSGNEYMERLTFEFE